MSFNPIISFIEIFLRNCLDIDLKYISWPPPRAFSKGNKLETISNNTALVK
jgi:hypothetical protein